MSIHLVNSGKKSVTVCKLVANFQVSSNNSVLKTDVYKRQVNIPREKLVVLTGLSGSGKSSLAFDTIYAEGQRRYVESLSSYARMFLGQMDKPDVENIEGLSPADVYKRQNYSALLL